MANPLYGQDNNYGMNKYNASVRSPYVRHNMGGEVDAGGSTETLSPDDRNALQLMQRQEPQGQEQLGAKNPNSTTIKIGSSQPYQTHTPSSNENNLSYSSSTNTLIIHHSIPDESYGSRWMAGYTTPSIPSKPQATFCSPEMDSRNNSSVYTKSANNTVTNPSFAYMANDGPVNLPIATEITDIPHSYLNKSEVLKHLINKETKDSSINKEMLKSLMNSSVNGPSGAYSDRSASSSNSALNMLSSDVVHLPHVSPNFHRPPPPYSHWANDQNDKAEIDVTPKRLADKNSLSKSQPDLSHVGLKELTPAKDAQYARLHPLYSDDDSNNSLKEIIDMLTRENHTLKNEIDYSRRKVARLQKFEIEMTKFEEQHDALVKMSERREQLERIARLKLNAEIKSLNDSNAELKEKLKMVSSGETLQGMRASSVPEDSGETAHFRKELARKDLIITQLVTQNRELTHTKIDLENRLLTQDKRVKEQQKQIEILDSALTTTQNSVVKLEDEVKKNYQDAEQIDHLKRLLASAHLIAEKRQQTEKMLRQKLEQEILLLRSESQGDQRSGMSQLRAEVREKSERIMNLETELSKFDQKKIQDSSGISSDRPTTKAALLDLINKETERQAMETREQLKHTEELEKLTDKIVMLEANNRLLKGKLTEREDRLRNMNNRSEDKMKAQLQSQTHSIKVENSESSTTRPVNSQEKLSTSVSVQNQQGPKRDEELDVTPFQSYPLNPPMYPRDEMLRSSDSSNMNSHPPPHFDVAQRLTEPSHWRVEVEKENGLVENEHNFEEVRLANDPSTAQSQNVATPSDHTNTNPQTTLPTPVVECQPFREAPPPYHGPHHSIVKVGEEKSKLFPIQLPPCHRTHPPNSFCRLCQNVRRSHRQPPTCVVRRSHSTASQSNRLSAPSPKSFLDSDEEPSILERLKIECQMGMLSTPNKQGDPSASPALPKSPETCVTEDPPLSVMNSNENTQNTVSNVPSQTILDANKNIELVIREDNESYRKESQK